MADEQILAAAQASLVRAEALDRDVRDELTMMSESLGIARATAKTIDRTDDAAREHADQMARQLAADAKTAESVVGANAEMAGTIGELLAAIERERLDRSTTAPVLEYPPLLVPPQPEVGGASLEGVKNVALGALTPEWLDMPDDERDLAEEIALAAKDVAAEAASEPEAPRTPDKPSPKKQKAKN